MIAAVLFDLDGTLIDTAADMGAALNQLLVAEGLPALDLNDIRPYVSQGALALTQLAFPGVSEVETEALRLRYLQHYRDRLCVDSTLFAGFDLVLNTLKVRHIHWGIVTNKPEYLTTPLLQALDLSAPVVICGDSLVQRKPHPLPLEVAARRLSVDCQQCVYIGDDVRDIVAGNAAGMKTLIAAYGYIAPGAVLHDWSADGLIQDPLQLLQHPLLN